MRTVSLFTITFALLALFLQAASTVHPTDKPASADSALNKVQSQSTPELGNIVKSAMSETARNDAYARREDLLKAVIPPTIAALGAVIIAIITHKKIQNLNVNVNGRISRLIELECEMARLRGLEEGRRSPSDNPPPEK